MRMRKLILIVDTGLEFAQIDKVRKGDYYCYSFLRVESWRFSLKYIIIMLLGCYCFIKRMQAMFSITWWLVVNHSNPDENLNPLRITLCDSIYPLDQMLFLTFKLLNVEMVYITSQPAGELSPRPWIVLSDYWTCLVILSLCCWCCSHIRLGRVGVGIGDVG